VPDKGTLPAWARSADVQIPAALALAVALALGEWQCARTLRRDGIGTDVAATGPPAAGAPAGPLDASVAETLARSLGDAPRGSPAWVAASADDAEASARAEQLRGILRQAGWDVRPLVRTAHRNRPGYFLFAAEEEPPGYVSTLASALEQAGIKPTFAVGYRVYYEEMARTRPDFVGFPFEPGQTFVLVVGRAS